MDPSLDSLHRLILRRSLGAMPGYIGNFITASLMAIVFARWMGIQDLGAFAFAFHVVRIVVLVAGMGLNMGAVRLIPRYMEQGRHAEITGFVMGSVLVTAAACAIFGALVFLFSLPAIEGTSSQAALWHADWLAAILGVGILLAGVMRAHGHTLTAAIAQKSGRNIAAMVIALLMVESGGALDARDGLVALALAVLLALIGQIAVLIWNRRLPFVRPVFRPGEWLSTSTPMMVTALGRLIIAGGDVIIIRLLLGEAQAGLYHAAITLAVAANLAGLAVSASVAPELARRDGPGDVAVWRAMFRYGLKLALVCDVILAGLIIAFGRTLLAWFGSDFVEAYPLLIVLTLGVLFQNVSFFCGTANNMTGGARKALPYILVMLTVAVCLSIAATATFGLMGTAVAYAFSRAMASGLLIVLLRRHRASQAAGTES